MKINKIKTAKLTIIAILLIAFQFSSAQDVSYTTFKGIMKDSKNKTEIVFGSISVVGTSVGTVTNSDGEFTIKVLKSINATQLEFSHIGYDSKKINISDLKSEGNFVLLKPSSVNLSEVTVRPKEASALMRKVVNKIPDNYNTKSVMSAGFYRETVKQARDYISISEALIDISKASYNQSNNDRVKVYKGRKSSKVKKADTLAVKLQGGPYTSLLIDVAKNPYILLDDEIIMYYTFKIADIKKVDGNLNYVVEFKPNTVLLDYPLYIGKYYIDINSLAITSVEFSLDLQDKKRASAMFVKKKPIGLKMTPLDTHYLVKYKKIDGKYYFNYSRSEFKFRCNWKKRLFNSTYSVMSEMAITDWDSESLAKFKHKESLRKNAVFEEEVTAFADENFWGEHNFIEPDQSIETAIKKYAKKRK